MLSIIPHHKVIRLDIPMDKVLAVHVLEPAYHLIRQHEDRLHGETTGAELKDILQGRSKQIHDKNVPIIPVCSVPSVV
jgi:hypothetical protein